MPTVLARWQPFPTPAKAEEVTIGSRLGGECRIFRRMRRAIVVLLLSMAAWPPAPALHAEPAPPDAQARFIAGLPVHDTPLEELSLSPAWAAHAVAFDSDWKRLEKSQLGPIHQWAADRLAEGVASTNPLLYMFSGPDILYAQAFFPKASTYVLCGIEPIGALPDVKKIPREALAPALHGLEKSLDSVLNFSFFITKEMKEHFKNTQLSGTLPVLYTFLARSGCHLDDVRMVTISSAGVMSDGSGPTPGVKITFTRAGQEPQTLYYICTDLSDDAVPKSGFLKWLDQLGKANGFAKAASYLMHGSNFSKIRQQLLNQCQLIVQDDSAIPVKYFSPENWVLQFYGRYLGPLSLFKQYPPEPELMDAYRHSNVPTIPFSFGYRWHPHESTLIVAERRAGPIPIKPATPATP